MFGYEKAPIVPFPAQVLFIGCMAEDSGHGQVVTIQICSAYEVESRLITCSRCPN